MDHATVNGVELEYEVVGSGDPMLFIHGALIGDAFRPLLAEPALEPFQLIHYHRRGVGGSTCPLATGPASLAVHAEDAIRLLDHLDVDQAHVVGHSSGGTIALELASNHTSRVASLALLEPALLMTPGGAAFVGAVAPLVERYAAGDAEAAVLGFLALVGGHDGRAAIERTVPGAIEHAVKDAASLFESELSAVPGWTLEPEQAAQIACPVLSVLGSETASMFVEGRELLHERFPGCHDADIDGATHLLQMEAPRDVAAALASFCRGARASEQHRDET